jgi:prevent-host-death family protein
VKVNIHEAKTQFSRLLARVAQGEEIIIARAGRPIARLLPIGKPRAARRRFFQDQGKFEVPDGFNDSDPAVDALFEGTD